MTTPTTKFGVNIWWYLPESSVDAGKVKEVLAKHGFETDDIKKPSRQQEVSRAVKSFHNRRSKAERRIGEKVGDTPSAATYGILDHNQVSASEVSFDQHTTVRLDKVTGGVNVAGVLKDEFNTSLSGFEGRITQDDIRTFLLKVVRMCYGIPKRPSGGIYFIPSQCVSVIDDAQAVLNELNTSSRIYIERVMDGVQEKKNVWESVEDEISTRLAEAVAAIGRIGRRASAVKTQEAVITEAQDLMGIYRDLLGEEAKFEAITEKIEEAVKAVSEKLTAIQSGEPIVEMPKEVKVVAQKEVKTVVAAPKAPEVVSVPVEVKVVKAPKTIDVVSVPVEVKTPKTPKAKKTPKAPVPPKAPKAGGGLCVADAAVEALKFTKKPMSCREIVDVAVKQGFYVSSCGFPYQSFNGTLARAIKKGYEKRVLKNGSEYRLA